MMWIKAIFLLAVCTKLLFAKEENISVAFVIDDTSSMSEDIKQVKSGVKRIFDAVKNSADSLVKNFILVTFNDHNAFGHKPEVLIETSNRDKFTRELDSIFVEGGGDCPEMSMSGIDLGLTKSRPGSYLYLFTDALAKDIFMLDQVQNKAIKKKIQIISILTTPQKACKYDLNDEKYIAYHQLATATSGQVFHMDKNDVGQILEYITDTMKKRKEPIVSKSYPPGYGHELEIPVDGDMKNVVIAESGDKTKMDIFCPDGTKSDVDKLVDMSGAKVVKIKDPKIGNCTAIVGSESNTSVVVTAETDVSFSHGFSAVIPTSLEDTSTMPVADTKSYLSVQLDSKDEVILEKVQLIGIDEKTIIEVPLKLIDTEKKLYITEDNFLPPDVLFNIAIKGLHVKSNTNITRLSRTPIEVQKIFEKDSISTSAPTMEIDKGPVTMKFNDPMKLTCKVKCYPKPKISWTDESGKILTNQVLTVSLPFEYMAVVDIEKVTANMTLKCAASNPLGDTSKILKVEVESFFNILEKPNDTTIEFMKSYNISCKIDASPPVNITWSKNGHVIKTDENVEIMNSSTVIMIKKMTPDLVGGYVCSAKNDLRTEKIKFELQISGVAPNVSTNKPSAVDVEYDEPFSINCRAYGYPEPSLSWYDNATDEELLSFTAESSSKYTNEKILLIEKVNENAVYRCTARNLHGVNSAVVSVNTLAYFKVLESPKSTDIEYRKDGKVYCRVAAKPPAEIIWYHRRVPLEKSDHYEISADNTTLTVKNMQPDLAGYYLCQIRNGINSTDISFPIEITGLTAPKINKTIKVINVLEGATLDINCQIIESDPAPTFSWKYRPFNKDRLELIEDLTNSSVHFEAVARYQSGVYRCIARNPKTIDNYSVDLNVEYPPSIEEQEKQQNAESGKKVMLKCSPKGKPAPSVTWFFNNTLIDTSADYTMFEDNSLKFLASSDKAGVFNCTATNKHGTASIAIKVVFFVSVKINPPLETKIETIAGKNIDLECEADGYPRPTIKWLFVNSSDLVAAPKVIRTAESPDILALKSIKLEQDGAYICAASNDIPSKSNMAYTLIVEAKPEIFNIYDKIFAVVGDNVVRVPCTATGRPKPDVTWLQNNLSIAEGSDWYDKEPDGTLIIKNITEGGTFTCQAENRLGHARKMFHVIAYDAPLASNPEASHRLKIDKPAEIACPLSYKVVDSVRWFKERTVLNTRKGILRFSTITSRDGGVYTCRVNRVTGLTESASIEIVVTA